MDEKQVIKIIEKAAKDGITELDLSNLGITELPAEIGQLTHLTTLILRNNKLLSLPAQIGQLTHLTTLDLSNNKLLSLPAQIGQLTHLTTLYLYSNQLSSLPAQIGQLTNLTSLDLQWNQLSSLPAQIGQLTDLAILNLYNNELSSLPAQIGQLTNLTRLDLWSNQLSRLPRQIRQLANLKTLDLRSNQFSIPPEILARIDEPAAILDFYFQEREAPLNQAKLVLVGEGRVGKTSLARRLIENQFDEKERITEGIAIKNWQVIVGDTEIQVNIWDFGGQEIMHATHQFFLTFRTLYILVLDVQKNEASNRPEYWLELIKSFAPDSPIIVVRNQIDQHSKLDLNRRDLREKYPKIKDFVEISCRNGEGIAKLVKVITARIGEFKHIRDKIAFDWLDVKRQLEGLGKDYVDYDDYVRLCQASHIHEEQEQRTLIRLLHDLGVMLNFQDHASFKKTSVLNPAWVTGGVYQIINAKQIKKNGGILQIEQLDNILDHARYPKEKHLFILNMMRKFELCFDLKRHTEERFLIPDLLPPEEPELKWSVINSLNFEYHYDVLPSSVISRFMVRMHRFIFQETYWRNGMVLVNNQDKAQVKAFPRSKKIVISMSVGRQSQLKLWAMIYSELEKIHKSIKGLKVKLWIAVYEPPTCHNCEASTIIGEKCCQHCQHSIPVRRDKEPMCQSCGTLNRESANLCVECELVLSVYTPPAKIVEYDALDQLEHDVVVGDNKVKIRELLEDLRPMSTVTEAQQVVEAKKYLKPLRKRAHPQDYYPAAFSLGELHYKYQEYTLAHQVFVEAHEAIEMLRGLILEEPAQVKLSAKSVQLYKMLVHCCLEEVNENEAFEYAAVAKGRAFVNRLANTSFDLESFAVERRDFARKLALARQKRSEIDKLNKLIGQKGANRDELFGQQSVLLREEARLWREMEREHPILTATLSVPILSAEQAKELAKELEATLVEYYRHAGGWCAFVVTSEEIRYVPLPRVDEDLLEELADWRNNVHRNVGRSRRRLKRLAKLYSAAVAPLGLASERVIIAPFEKLHLLPLSATYVVNRSGEKCYLAERHTLSYVPSLTALHVVYQEQKRRPSSQTFERLLSVAYPGTPPLPNVLEEAEAIADRLADVATIECLHEEDATPDNVLKRLKRAPYFDVIHFGCHGRFESDKPKESGLILAQKPLTVEEIISELNLKQTRLATLAACLTGEVALRKGEEHIGLLQAMMTAGVQTVVASLWVVDDAATCALFEAFYSQEALINAPAQAMREASKLLRETGPWKHPFHWAAFQVNGLVARSAPSFVRTTLAQGGWPPDDLSAKMQKYAPQSRKDRRKMMSEEKMIENAELLLKDLLEGCEDVLHALQPPYELSKEVAQRQIVAQELSLAQALVMIVRDNPALDEFIGEDVGALRIDPQQHVKAQKPTPSSEKNGQVWNEVGNVFDELVVVLQQEYKSPKKKHNKSGLLKRVFARFLSHREASH